MLLTILRSAFVLVSLCGLCLSISCSDGEDAEEPLEIVRLEHESLVFYNGDRLPLTIHWSGAAEFPITVSVSGPEGACPADVTCVDEQHRISDDANPIVVPDALWCEGQGSAFSVDWNVTIEDAGGARSEPAQMTYTCRE